MPATEADKIFKIKRNLSDAGCEAALIEYFLELAKCHKRNEQYWLLSGHRADLLDKLHEIQYKIDCVDYMIYTMKKEDGGN